MERRRGILLSLKLIFGAYRIFGHRMCMEFEGRYYLFAPFSNAGVKRGTSILQFSDKCERPFHSTCKQGDYLFLPAGCVWTDLSYIDKEGNPWLLFCSEWLEAIDGEIYAQRLAKDLKTTEGEMHLFSKASEAPWVGSLATSG